MKIQYRFPTELAPWRDDILWRWVSTNKEVQWVGMQTLEFDSEEWLVLFKLKFGSYE